jgi:hypothetical protein
MRTDFQFVALPIESFTNLFSMNDAELASLGARRMTVDERPGYPCRVSLMDAPAGEHVILTSFQHHDANSPYQSLEDTIRDFFTDASISYLHLHNAAPGCFNCAVQRA